MIQKIQSLGAVVCGVLLVVLISGCPISSETTGPFKQEKAVVQQPTPEVVERLGGSVELG